MKHSLRARIRLYSILFMAAIIVLASVVTFIFCGNAAKKQIELNLDRISREKNLNFEARMNSQLILALQMSKSSVIIDYFQNPKDKSLFEAAVKEFKTYKKSFVANTCFWINKNDMRFYSDLEYAYTVDPDNPDDYWFDMTMKQAEAYNFNINYNKELKKSMLWLNVVVKDAEGSSIGIVGTAIPISDFVNDLYKDIDPSVEMYLYNKAHEITGAKNSDLVINKTKITDVVKELTSERANASVSTFYHLKKTIMLVAPVDVIGWKIVIKRAMLPADYRSATGLLLFLMIVLTSAAVITFYNIFFNHAMDKTSVLLTDTAEKAKYQVELMDQVNSTITENVNYLEQFGELISRQIRQVETSVDNTTDLMNDLDAINILRKDSIASTNDLSDSSKKGNTHIANITDKIGELSECAKRLSAANNLIASITSKTNLLAMNAAIEASHAGEQGKGFAVVAKEIRALAEKSRTQQQDVSRAIDEINHMISDMVQYSATAKESFDEIVANTEKVNANFQNMSNKLESEASLVQTISVNLQNVTGASQKINSNFEEMKDSNKLITKEIVNAVNSSSDMLGATEDLLTTIR